MSGVGWVCDAVLLWVAKIRVLGTRVLREGWDADVGGVVVDFGLVVGLLGIGEIAGFVRQVEDAPPGLPSPASAHRIHSKVLVSGNFPAES